ncbi:mitogen-activated protein kinase kinase kinase 1 [Tripterygium wilfordii]|uniref:mitogen-activated protein kinase kinase kinase n=1 Tax=Tripterygium wilfordii TaxID=458696 RepID=A0A7J7D076_TRIWF|nr:mitogen-activated protein kinase kinase kinase 1-like [Tripterygium wilfordii]KAF5739688.1 mitogen-activated protein kinase kinase kinase 1 [Tripterygium wilfordii]
MHHLPRFFAHSNRSGASDSKKKLRPKLERRNAVKNIKYDAASLSSSLDDSSYSSSLQTRSLELYEGKSFRVEGEEGEIDRIFRSLGLSGPEDLGISTAAWEASKIRSSSAVLPRSKYRWSDSTRTEDVKQNEEEHVQVSDRELCDRVSACIRIRDGDGNELDRAESIVSNAYHDIGVVSRGAVVGIKGVRPPLLKPPPSMRLPVIDNARSTWDIFRDFAPENDRASLVIVDREFNSSVLDREQKQREANLVADKIEEEEEEEEEESMLRADVTALLSESCSFSTSNDDDSSSTTTEQLSNISPNGRLMRTITSWEKGNLLGRGSYGSVYEGLSNDGFFFAVKEVSLLDQGSQGKQSVYQLEQEIALLSQFEHENIVQYYGTDKDDSTLYIFLELVTKGSLLNLYQRYHLMDSQVSAYTRQILHGLKYLHDRNVVHRDIKCANILVDANGSVKLADFGLAKATKLNDVKSCKGTAFWMAPEVVNRKNQGYGLPADIWSLGCTVLEMLTHKIPYSHLESMQALFRIGKGEPPPVPDSLSGDARDFILQCLQAKPNHRPTAAQLLEHPFVKMPLPSYIGSPYIGRRS